ncbi:O-methyltransferase [Anaeromyxobacter paludicola]|uniref:O-methyltransferase n=1 Tax=Anaeromyxobacter paludicola TaxID=2918171 RepID=A0ABN6N814_9BACT|nr:class I SAM-dependent methyltransferase [Anaeromyxobacter paludicola]BDG09338.1 O-methyltransferase [Anaeromyxobacter paludicola]
MSAAGEKGFGQGSEELARWVDRVFQPEDPLLREIRERTVAAGLRPIQVGPFDGLHLEVLARAAGARRAVEIGTLGGYSGVCLLRGMGEGGLLHTFEREPATAEVAAETFRRAGLERQVRLHVGDARVALREIDREGPFDLVFIDADKTGYPEYLAWAEENLRVGGTVLADNAFGWGGVAQERYEGRHAPEGVEALKRFNERLAKGGRLRATMLPTEEGLAMGVKVR